MAFQTAQSPGTAALVCLHQEGAQRMKGVAEQDEDGQQHRAKEQLADAVKKLFKRGHGLSGEMSDGCRESRLHPVDAGEFQIAFQGGAPLQVGDGVAGAGDGVRDTRGYSDRKSVV